jgi:hypothetical protein
MGSIGSGPPWEAACGTRGVSGALCVDGARDTAEALTCCVAAGRMASQKAAADVRLAWEAWV